MARRTGQLDENALIAEWAAPVLLGLVCACGGEASTPSVPGEDDVRGPGEARNWVFPEGGTAVDTVPIGAASLTSVDAYGNLWLQGCEGLFVVGQDEIRRYRYTDSAWRDAWGQLFHDAEGRTWVLSNFGVLQRIEDGQWQTVIEDGLLQDFVLGSDGAAWVRRLKSDTTYDSTIQRIWPTLGPTIDAPRFGFEMVAGAAGQIWYSISGENSEVWRFDGSKFWGPYPDANGPIAYDPARDAVAFGLDRRLYKLRFDGSSLVPVGNWDVPWFNVVAYDAEGRLLYSDGDYHLVEDDQDSESLVDDLNGVPVLSASRELYLARPRNVLRYGNGEVQPVFEFGPQNPPSPPPPPWAPGTYGRALREVNVESTVTELRAPPPDLFGRKLRLIGVPLGPGFEGPYATIYVDGASVIGMTLAPELFELLVEQGIALAQPDELTGAPVAGSEAWELTGYLQPDTCFDGSTSPVFVAVEGYPLSLPPDRRAALEADLRARHPE